MCLPSSHSEVVSAIWSHKHHYPICLFSTLITPALVSTQGDLFLQASDVPYSDKSKTPWWRLVQEIKRLKNEIYNIRGKESVLVDALSRHPGENNIVS